MSTTCIAEIESHWKVKTSMANELFEKKLFDKALKRYKDALYRAEVLNNYASVCKKAKVPFIQVYIISCNNIAYTYEALGLTERAESMFKRAIYFLIHLCESDENEREVLRNELSRATVAYTDFVKKHSIPTLNKEQVLFDVKEHSLEL